MRAIHLTPRFSPRSQRLALATTASAAATCCSGTSSLTSCSSPATTVLLIPGAGLCGAAAHFPCALLLLFTASDTHRCAQAYVQPPAPGERGVDRTLIQEWTNIDNNFVMVGPKMGALYGPGNGTCSNGMWQRDCPKGGGSMFTCLDHDDGSDYYLDTRNVCVFAGMKNYIGQNKVRATAVLVGHSSSL